MSTRGSALFAASECGQSERRGRDVAGHRAASGPAARAPKSAASANKRVGKGGRRGTDDGHEREQEQEQERQVGRTGITWHMERLGPTLYRAATRWSAGLDLRTSSLA